MKGRNWQLQYTCLATTNSPIELETEKSFDRTLIVIKFHCNIRSHEKNVSLRSNVVWPSNKKTHNIILLTTLREPS